MFKVIEFYVQAFAVRETAEGRRRTPVGAVRKTRDEAQAQAWARETRDRLDRRGRGQAHEVLVYGVIGEPMFDLWAEPRVKGRYSAGTP